MSHPLQSSPHYARYLEAESLIYEATELFEAWSLQQDVPVPHPVERFVYEYFWNDRGAPRQWFARAGLNSFPHQVHPDELHLLELATYNAEAMAVSKIVDRWCTAKHIEPWSITDLAAISETQFLDMRRGNYDEIARYLRATFQWWLKVSGPRTLRENLELNRAIKAEREATKSLSWKIHSTLVRFQYAKRPFPVRGARR
jgi:hypothetical protein